MNLFTNYKLVNDTFKANSEEVLVNGKPQQAIITTSYLGLEEKRHLNSLEPFKRGDYIEYRDETYIVIEEVETPRHNKYRATMRYCDYVFTVRDLLGRVEIGRDEFNKPVYDYIYSDPYHIHSAIKQWDRSALSTNDSVNLMQTSFFIDMQDTEKNREKFATNEEFEIKGKSMKVTLQDRSQSGLLGVLFADAGQP